MNLFRDAIGKERYCRFAAVFLVFWLLASNIQSQAQTPDVPFQSDPTDIAEAPGATTDFRIEKVRVDGGADLLTIIARPHKAGNSADNSASEMPLVSILRDTLGDNNPENDQLRYVWMLTYANPSLGQKAAALVPFLYSRTTNNDRPGTAPPPPVIDLKPADRGPWNKFFQAVFKNIILGQFGVGIKSSVLQYGQNKSDYRRSAIAKALTVVALYQARSNHAERLLSESDLKDIQARLTLTDKLFGSHMQSENLGRVYDKELEKSHDIRNQNWELLRQYSEAQGLYFDPLEMPDGSARHALVWISASDIEQNKNRKFDSRFLNIKNPWTDRAIANWKGYSQVRWFDGESRQVAPNTPGATERTFIPLALYGLDFPKIPALLVDFRDNSNVTKREMSKRILHDITRDTLSFGQLSNLPYFLGRTTYDWITGKRGMDINQTSRLRSYSQLKLLLSLDTELDVNLRAEIAKRVEHATLNPLENDLETEAQLARTQYENLLAYAKRPDGLPAHLDKDRREEMVKFVHNRKERLAYSAAHFFSLGLFTKREKSTPELMAALDIGRQLDRHERYLREVAFSSADPEVDSDIDALRTSLEFVSQNGAAAKEKTTRALAKIFKITHDEDIRRLCVTGLYRINNSEAKNQLLAIYGNSNTAENWRNLCAHYLKLALSEGQQISTRDARAIGAIEVN
jgi:hypothetical protein